jgi:hypothetical protein
LDWWTIVVLKKHFVAMLQVSIKVESKINLKEDDTDRGPRLLSWAIDALVTQMKY